MSAGGCGDRQVVRCTLLSGTESGYHYLLRTFPLPQSTASVDDPTRPNTRQSQYNKFQCKPYAFFVAMKSQPHWSHWTPHEGDTRLGHQAKFAVLTMF